MFGLKVNLVGVGNVGREFSKASLHDVRSKADKAFHADNVKSVCVYDESGVARLYLKKEDNGEVRREYR